MRRFQLRTLCASAGLAAGIAAFTLSPAGSAVRHTLSSVQTANEADNAYVFINTNPSGGAVSGQVAPSQYTVTAQAGLFGVFDPGTSDYGDGVLGLSYTGNGVVGQALSGNYSGVFGEAQGSATGPGVEGIGTTATAVGVLGASNYTTAIMGNTGQPTAATYAAGVEGQDLSTTANNNNDGVYGQTTMGRIGVEGDAGSGAGAGVGGYSGNIGVFGYSQFSNAVYAYGLDTAAASLYIENVNGTATSGTGSTPALMFYALGDTTNDFTSIDVSGNIVTSGTVTSGAGTATARTRNPATDVMTYSAQHTEDTVEDFGTANLVNGQATVPLAADFRQTINTAMSYMVFVTPDGDTRGLYVASKTPQGFVVKETQNGRSTLAFDYRIVAHPYGAARERLPHFGATAALLRSNAAGARDSVASARRAHTLASLTHPAHFAKVGMPKMPPMMKFRAR